MLQLCNNSIASLGHYSNPDNKELRLLTRLTEEEKQIAAKICLAFQQNICGFDIIRWRGKSNHCDFHSVDGLAHAMLHVLSQASPL